MGSDIITDHEGIRFSASGARFKTLLGDDRNRVTTDDEIVILKAPPMLAKYDAVMVSLPARNVVEIGIAEGGSLIYLALAFPHLRFIGIDLRKPNPAVDRHIERLGLSDRISLHYGVDQADQSRVRSIISDELGGEQVGAIIDDASHFYEPSRKTFEATFGLLATGGMYCLEDWAWAHERGRQVPGAYGWDKYALSNLVFEIIMLQPSTRDLVRSIRVDRNITFIERGALNADLFELDELIQKRGRKLELI